MITGGDMSINIKYDTDVLLELENKWKKVIEELLKKLFSECDIKISTHFSKRGEEETKKILILESTVYPIKKIAHYLSNGQYLLILSKKDIENIYHYKIFKLDNKITQDIFSLI